MLGFLLNLFKPDTRTPAQKKADEEKEEIRKERIRSARSWYRYLETMRERKRYLEKKEKRRKRLEKEEKELLEAAENRSKFILLLLQLLFAMLDIILEKQRYRIEFRDPLIQKKTSPTIRECERCYKLKKAAKAEVQALANESSSTQKKPTPPTPEPIKKVASVPSDIPMLDGTKTAAEMGVISNGSDMAAEENVADMSLYETMYKMLMPKGKQLVESGASREGITNLEYLKRNEKRYREVLGIDEESEMTPEQRKKAELKKRLKNQSHSKEESPEFSPGN